MEDEEKELTKAAEAPKVDDDDDSPTQEAVVESADAGADAAGDDAGTQPDAGKAVQSPAAGGDGGGIGAGVVAQPDPLQVELKALTDKIEADDFDPYSKDGKKVLMQRQDLSAQLAANRAMVSVSSWDDAEDEYGLPKRELRGIWKESRDEAAKQIGRPSDDAAFVIFKQKVAAKKSPPATPAKKGAVAPTPITAKGGRTIPPNIRAVPEQPDNDISDEDALVKSVGKRMAKIPGSR